MNQSANKPHTVTAPDPTMPPVYVPIQTQSTWLGRLGWRLSKFGHARLGWWRARSNPDSAPLRASFAARVEPLSLQRNNFTPERKKILRDMMLYLAWSNLRAGHLAQAEHWLSAPDDFSGAEVDRLSLRWDLMRHLREARSNAEYATQASQFLADPQSAYFSEAILETLGTVYTAIPLEQRIGMAEAVNPALIHDERVRAALVQWQCPATFVSQSEARSWSSAIVPGPLNFAPEMQADALVALGHIAEWERNWERMAARAEAALQIIADHASAILLLTRSRLRRGESTSAELAAVAPNSPKWRRLQLQCEINETGNLKLAGDLIGQFPDILRDGDALELDLALNQIENVLTLATPVSPEQLKPCAELSSRLEELAGPMVERLPFFKFRCGQCGVVFEFSREMDGQTAQCPACQSAVQLKIPTKAASLLPWAEVNLALAEIELDLAPEKAVARLENPELAVDTTSQQLARLSRVLAGSPKAAPEAGDPVAVLGAALRRILGPSESPNIRWGEMAEKISAVLGDPLLQEFSALKSAAEILLLATQVLDGNPSAREQVFNYQLRADTPAWSAWLLSRIIGLLADFASANTAFSRMKLDENSVAWLVETWWSHYGVVGSPVPSALAAARNTGARLGVLRLNSTALKKLFPEIGELASQHCGAEAKLDAALAQARVAFSNGETSAAITQLQELMPFVKNVSPLAEAWWQPAITYWLGVAFAHQHDDHAAEIFASLAGGICAQQSLGQTALLYLQKNEPAVALQKLNGVSDQIPSVRYARAVSLAWTGRHDEARELLESPEAANAFAESTYALAARRLSAAIRDRAGQPEESVQLHRRLLQDFPGDAIATLRLVRHECETAYAGLQVQPRTTNPAHADLLGAITSRSPEISRQKNAMAFLLDFLQAAESGAFAPLVKKLDKQITTQEDWSGWRLLLAAGMLRARDVAGAQQVLDVSNSGTTANSEKRSRIILDIWAELAVSPKKRTDKQAVKKLEGLAHALDEFITNGNSDATANRWRTLAQIGCAIYRREPVPPEQWRQLGDLPLAHVPFLLSEDVRLRRAAAEALQPTLLQSNSPWSVVQRQLLEALVAWATENDAVYLEKYAALEPGLSELPLPGRDLWIAAALIRYAKKDWKNLMGNFPDCVADMTDSLVKLLVELAAARSAAEQAVKNERKDHVIKNIVSVRNNLRDLVENLPAEPAIKKEAGHIAGAQ